MRVLIISPLYPTENAPYLGIFVKRQVDALQSNGIEVVLNVSSSSEPRRRLFRKFSQLAIQAIGSFRIPFDVIHVHYPTIAGVIGSLVGIVRRKPMVVTLHGGEIDESQYQGLNSFKKSLTRLSTLWSLRRASAIITVGPGLAETAISKGIPVEKVSVIDMGVDCNVFHPRSKKEARQRLGIGSDFPLIIFVGTIYPIKGPEYFLRAAHLVNQRHPDCRWYLVGGGSHEQNLRLLARELGISEKVCFIGERSSEDIALWDAAADIFVMPSLAEGFGLAALEAMACGTPVIASDVGGLSSFVIDGKNGFLVAPTDFESIASRIDLLLGDGDLRERMGRKGVDIALQHDLRLQARKVISIYEKVQRV